MPRSTATQQPNAIKRVKSPIKSQTPDQKNATDLTHGSKVQEVEQVASMVKSRAKAPVDRTAELLLEESDVTNAGISTAVFISVDALRALTPMKTAVCCYSRWSPMFDASRQTLCKVL